MGNTVTRQHPAVVLRSHFRRVCALLAVAMVAVVALSAVTVILATTDDGGTTTARSAPQLSVTPPGQIRYDGGPEEGTRGISRVEAPGVRYDGGPEEGSRGFGR